MSSVRVGVIGLGRMGTVHARFLVEHPEVDTLVLADVDRERAGALAEDLGVAAAPTVDAVFRDVDAIVIAAPTAAHAELIAHAAGAGLPTFCEKPIALDLDETTEAVRRVREADIPFQVGFQRRFDPGYCAARDLVTSGKLGTLYVVRLAGHDPEPPHEAYIAESGGIFRDLHIHDFDVARFVTGQEVESVYADGGVLEFDVFEKYDDIDTAVAVLRFSGGTLGVLTGARHDPLGYDIRMEVFGSGDSIAVGWDGRTPLRSVEPGGPPQTDEPYSHFSERFADAYRAELDTFLAVAQGSVASPCTPEDAQEALRIAVACDRSRAEQRPISLHEIP